MTRKSDFRHRCTTICEALWWILCNSANLHTTLLLWSPSVLLMVVARLLTDNYKETYAVCLWEEPGRMRGRESGCPFNRDVFETPTHRGWPAFYALLGATFMFGLIGYRNNPRRLKQVTFWLHFLITTTIRGLSTFSGWTTQPAWSSLIWNSNSPGKICWLWLLVECGCWNWTYLGFHNDYFFHEPTRTVHDRNSNAIWTFTSEKTGDSSKDDIYTPYSLMFRPWRDIAVRLSYIHLIDNTIHVIWFRYFHVDAPYTTYTNNSEILTVLLFASLAVYTCTRMRTHVYFDDDAVAGPLIDIKSTTIPLPMYSATRDLFTFASPHHIFRTASESRQIFILSMCVFTMAAVATWELYPWVESFWWGVLYGVVHIISKVIVRSCEDFGKMWARRTVVQSPEQIKYHGGFTAVV